MTVRREYPRGMRGSIAVPMGKVVKGTLTEVKQVTDRAVAGVCAYLARETPHGMVDGGVLAYCL